MSNSSSKNKIIIVGALSALIIAVVATTFLLMSSKCTLDGKSACYDRNVETFLIEDKAELTVQVESEELGEYLVSKWNELHPTHLDKVSYIVRAPLTLEELSQGLETDIIVTTQNNAAFALNMLYDMPQKVSSVVGSTVPSLAQDTINLKGYYFVQNSIKGPLFTYNKTLMEELGFDLKDEDNSSIPDVFESWDKIAQNVDPVLQEIDVLFPLTFTDQISFYPFLTGGRWSLNFTNSGSEPGFDSKEFRDGLKLVEAMGNTAWDKTTAEPLVDETKDDETKPQEEKPDTEKPSTETTEEVKPNNENTPLTEEGEEVEELPEIIDYTKYRNTAESLEWKYESAFYERQSLFTIVNDFDFARQYAEASGDEYVYTAFPSNDGYRLTPSAEVDGYAVNKDVKYISAAAEVLRILRSGEAVTNYYNSTHKTPIYHRNLLEVLSIEDNMVMEQIKAYNYSDAQPVMALDKNPKVLARSIYTSIDMMPVLRDLYDGKIDVETAQKEIVALSKEWLEKHDIIEEE
ncbi:ABC transporter substrate-binding protein [Erysipelothrix sp. HDW6A]|uniref:ABC transporter substrate-binding protein n=1 Tax=Erysipelothrix sp. HDW6A TaxID=2714928 RepID=UPI001409AD49|nr:ABC transporter substrate-binding protein [Erysipelothrix sp. HDW6A]QIK56410.1 ABC transporter substrate-binding protein [Erysipelothrix sp. HDW6A]